MEKKLEIKRKCVIMRGLPGSGKSYLAKKIASEWKDGESVVLSTDDYFMNEKGEYVFDKAR